MINEFMACIGVGAATLTLELKRDTFSRGSAVEGTLTLEGGTVEQHIERLIVSLQEYRQGGKNSYWVPLNQIAIAQNITITPQEMQQFTFQLPIPASTHLTTSIGFQEKTTLVAAEADILWAVNPRTGISVQITPEPEILVMDIAMGHLGFTEMRDTFEERPQLFPSLTNASGNILQKTYVAPPAIEEQITHATLQLGVEYGWVRGRLLLNRTEIHLADYLKAMVGGDKEEFSIDIPSERLQNPQGPATAVTIIQEMLNRALILPDNEQNWLLRASSNPDTGADILLRPAGSQPESHVEELLHPASPDPPGEEGETRKPV